MTAAETYGLLSIGAVEVALPLSSLREVVRRPDTFAALATTHEALLGAMELRGTIIPVLDLTRGLGVSRPDGTSGSIVVIVSDGSHVLALLVDAIRGVANVEPGRLQPLKSASVTPLFTSTFQQQSGDVTCVLDLNIVMNLPGIPTVPEALAIDANAAVQKVATRRLTLLKCGNYTLAINVADIHTSLPGRKPSASVLARENCLGTVEFRDHDIALIDPMSLLGLGTVDIAKSRTHIVFELSTGYVAFAITELISIVDIEIDALFPLAATALNRPDLVEGVIEIPGQGVCFVLDCNGLRAEPNIVAFGGLNTPAASNRKTSTAVGALELSTESATRGAPYLAYSAGVSLATPLDQIDEIIPFPTDFTTAAVEGHVAGIIVHRNAAVPMLCLRSVLGLDASDERNRCLLLVSTERGKVAFIADRLQVVDSVAWRDPDSGTGTAGRTDPDAVLSKCDLIQIGSDETLIADLDLQALGLELTIAS